jgi:hypothetical protein
VYVPGRRCRDVGAFGALNVAPTVQAVSHRLTKERVREE